MHVKHIFMIYTCTVTINKKQTTHVFKVDFDWLSAS